MAGADHAGCFGKLSSVGDFVQRRLPAAFVSAWDDAFQPAVSAARLAFADRWQPAWRAAPVWRFVLPSGVCGAPMWAGVTGPSLDRVGRGFPMVLAWTVDDDFSAESIVRCGSRWFDALEQVCRTCLDAGITVDSFDAALVQVPPPCSAPQYADVASVSIDWERGGAWRTGWHRHDADEGLAALWRQCREVADGCLWWTHGGQHVPPTALLTRGLPAPEAYAAFIDARMAATHWCGAGAAGNVIAEPVAAEAAPPRVPDGPAPVELDDVLADLLPQSDTLQRTLTPTGSDAIARSEPDRGTVHVVQRRAGSTLLMAADNGPDDDNRYGATRVAAALGEYLHSAGMSALEAQLHALQAPLRERAADLVSPVDEDVAVLVMRLADGQATLLRAGAATAWRWRRNEGLHPLFAPQGRSMELPLAQPGESGGTMPGVGAPNGPVCEEVACTVAAGDRIALLLTGKLVNLPAGEELAGALGVATVEEASRHIAMAAGFSMQEAAWPLTVIEVGT